MPTSEITLRPAKYSELWTASQVLARAFYGDVLFGRHIHPHRDKYPEDMALFWYRAMQSEYWDWAMVFLVAVEQDEREGERIVGVAQWHRMGDGARRDGWGLGWWDLRNLLRPLGHVQSTLLSHLRPNRAIRPNAATILADADPYTSHLWNSRPERWYLHFLAVDPAHQSKGVGRALVAWGFQRAVRERVGVSVVAAYGKDRFYWNCGFRRTLGWAGQGSGNPLGEIPGGRICWFKEGEDYEETVWDSEEGEVRKGGDGGEVVVRDEEGVVSGVKGADGVVVVIDANGEEGREEMIKSTATVVVNRPVDVDVDVSKLV